jgi:hypothetical protein
MEMGHPLTLAICVMLDHSFCFCSSLSGNQCILSIRNRKAAIFCLNV